MLKSFLITTILFSLPAFGAKNKQTIKGKVTLSESIKKTIPKNGVLFIFAKTHGIKERRPPLAVKRIVSPKFPLEFELSDQDSMVPGTKFEGKVQIVARFSPSGMVFPKKGSFEGATGEKAPVVVGESGSAKIIIDKKL